MNKMFGVIRSKGVVASVAAVSMLAVSSAHAALPVWATGTGATLQTAMDDAVTEYGPVIVAALVIMLTIKFIKRVANKI